MDWNHGWKVCYKDGLGLWSALKANSASLYHRRYFTGKETRRQLGCGPLVCFNNEWSAMAFAGDRGGGLLLSLH